MKLYEINEQLFELLESIELAGGEITPEQEAELDKLELAKDDKLANIGFYIKHLDGMSDALDMQLEYIKKQKQRLSEKREGYANFLKHQIGEGLAHNGITLGVAKNPPKVIIDDESLVPEQYIVTKVKETKSIDKKQIASDIKQNVDLSAFAKLEQSTRLTIK